MQSLSVNASLPPPYPAVVTRTDSRSDFHERLAALRKERGLTQQALEVISKPATASSVTSDQLLFGKDEHGPDDNLRLQFEAISRFDGGEKRVVRSVLEGTIVEHEVRRWQSTANGGERK